MRLKHILAPRPTLRPCGWITYALLQSATLCFPCGTFSALVCDAKNRKLCWLLSFFSRMKHYKYAYLKKRKISNGNVRAFLFFTSICVRDCSDCVCYLNHMSHVRCNVFQVKLEKPSVACNYMCVLCTFSHSRIDENNNNENSNKKVIWLKGLLNYCLFLRCRNMDWLIAFKVETWPKNSTTMNKLIYNGVVELEISQL